MTRLAVIVHFWNMEREAPRTLYALHRQLKRTADREPIILPVWGDKAVNIEVQGRVNSAVSCNAYDSSHVAVMLDGARVPSPGCVAMFQEILKDNPDAFVYTLPLHLGPGNQAQTVKEGYNQEREDRTLASVPWQTNGYELFNISSHCGALGDPEKGFYAGITESCFFAMKRESWLELGGYDERFQAPGGGLANLEFFRRAQNALQPVCLLGEATFHQFHNGVSSNVPPEERTTEAHDEYQRIFGEPFRTAWVEPEYFGTVRPEARWAFK